MDLVTQLAATTLALGVSDGAAQRLFVLVPFPPVCKLTTLSAAPPSQTSHRSSSYA